MLGKLSVFGGSKDTGMTHTEGLALYEHHEADLRPDLFGVRNFDLTEGSSKRLKDDALYFAYRFDHADGRKKLQNRMWKLKNPANQKWVVASLVDWGPHVDTERVFDVSPRVAELLGMKTDDEMEGEPL